MSRELYTYKNAGVNIEEADKFAGNIAKQARSTFNKGVMFDIGGFASLFNISDYVKDMEEPVVVSSTDGVGTKLLIAQQLGIHNTVGIDLVAMCVNDLITQGAKPLFFLDYIATGKVKPDVLNSIMEGITTGCRKARMALIGGETAEMPDMLDHAKYDLAGFAVGIVDKKNIKPEINDMREDDVLIGVESGGFHSNGYSLLRKLPIDYSFEIEGVKFSELLLRPTEIYVDLMSKIFPYIKGAAHITGGGLAGNIPRIIPETLCAEIDLSSWEWPPVFQFVRKAGIATNEMLKVFNVGIGMVCVARNAEQRELISVIQSNGYKCYVIGRLKKRGAVGGIHFINNICDRYLI